MGEIVVCAVAGFGIAHAEWVIVGRPITRAMWRRQQRARRNPWHARLAARAWIPTVNAPLYAAWLHQVNTADPAVNTIAAATLGWAVATFLAGWLHPARRLDT